MDRTKYNLILAFSFNGVGVPAAMTGLVHPIWAMAAMVASVSTVLLSSFGGRLIKKTSTTATRKKKRKIEDRVEKITLKVPTIHCENCIASIIQSISEIEGVESVEGDAENKLIVITHRGSAKIRDLVKQEITKEGHVVA